VWQVEAGAKVDEQETIFATEREIAKNETALPEDGPIDTAISATKCRISTAQSKQICVKLHDLRMPFLLGRIEL
jgi:hypothetical protein